MASSVAVTLRKSDSHELVAVTLGQSDGHKLLAVTFTRRSSDGWKFVAATLVPKWRPKIHGRHFGTKVTAKNSEKFLAVTLGAVLSLCPHRYLTSRSSIGRAHREYMYLYWTEERGCLRAVVLSASHHV